MHKLDFPDRTVVLAQGTKDAMAHSATLLNCVAEVARLRRRAQSLMGMDRAEQHESVDDADQDCGRAHTAARCCLLDTGVNRADPLIEVISVKRT